MEINEKTLIIPSDTELSNDTLKAAKKSTSILIRRNSVQTKEFDSEKYYKRSGEMIDWLRDNGIDKDIILECETYDEIKTVGIDDKKVGYVYDIGYINVNQKPVNKDEAKVINDTLDLMVKNIKESGVSELEKFIACYKIVTSYKPFLKKAGTKDCTAETYTNEILFNDYILCGGYSYLLMELLKRVGINSKYYNLDAVNENETNHARLLVSLKQGYYVCDPTCGLKVQYYRLYDYAKTHSICFDSLKEYYGSKFDSKKVKEYVDELLDDLEHGKHKKYNEFREVYKKIFAAKASDEDRLLSAIFGDNIKNELCDLKASDLHVCSDEIEKEFEGLVNLDKNLRHARELDLISRKYKELPVMYRKSDVFKKALNTFEESAIYDDGVYTCIESMFLDFYDREGFYGNLYANIDGDNKDAVFKRLFDMVSILSPVEFRALSKKYPKALSDLTQLDPEFKDFLSEIYELIMLKNNNEISLEDIVLAASKVEQKILGLNEEQRKKYYDSTLKVNTIAKGAK